MPLSHARRPSPEHKNGRADVGFFALVHVGPGISSILVTGGESYYAEDACAPPQQSAQPVRPLLHQEGKKER